MTQLPLSSNPPATPILADFPFHHRLAVRLSEVDVQAVVFNANYLMYFDTAMGEAWRAWGIPYRAAMAALGGELYVRRAEVDYLAPAQLGDWLSIGIRLLRVGRTSITLQGAVFREHRLLTQLTVTYVYTDRATRQPQPLPPALVDIWTHASEATSAAAIRPRLMIGDWATLGADAQGLRRAVFVQEQGVPEEEEWDAGDATAMHAVLYNHLGQAIATGRLLRDGPAAARIGRMAVHQALRGQGWGAQVLDGLIEAARQRGDQTVRLNAQQSALAFYRRRGFEAQGDPFVEVGIPHQAMLLALR